MGSYYKESTKRSRSQTEYLKIYQKCVIGIFWFLIPNNYKKLNPFKQIPFTRTLEECFGDDALRPSSGTH
jgi:hypothetical protein